MFASDLGELFNTTVCKGNQFIRSVNSSTTHSGAFPRMAPSSAAVINSLPSVGQSGFSSQSQPKLSSSPNAIPGASIHSSTSEQVYRVSDYPYCQAEGHSVPTSSPLSVEPTVVWSRPLAPANPLTESGSTVSSEQVMYSVASQQTPSIPSVSRGILRCPFCYKSFSNSSAIAKHKLTHSEERKYVCSICHKAFKRQDHLNGHKYTHETKKPHGCCFCDKSYSDARSLRRHYENTHPVEYERWVALSQATNGDTTAIAAAAAALLSSSSNYTTAVDLESHVVAHDESASTNAASTSLLQALNNPVCKLFASLNKSHGSPASNTTNEGRNNGSGGLHSKSRRPKENRHGRKSKPFGAEWSSIGSSRSSDSADGSVSNLTSPSGMIVDDADQEETTDSRLDKPNPLVTLSSITAEDISAAAKVALLIANPLEAPKRVACAVCQKRFKNQSALNGHMRLHGGYGPAGLTAPAPSVNSVNPNLSASRSSVNLDTTSSADETNQNLRSMMQSCQPQSNPTVSRFRGCTGSLLSSDVSTVFSSSNHIKRDDSNSVNRVPVSDVTTAIPTTEVTFVPHTNSSFVTRCDDSWITSRHSSTMRSMCHPLVYQLPSEMPGSNDLSDLQCTQPRPPQCHPPVHPNKSSTLSNPVWISGFLDDDHWSIRDASEPRSSSGHDFHVAATVSSSASSSCSDYHRSVNRKPLQRIDHSDIPSSLAPIGLTNVSIRIENSNNSSVVGPKAYGVIVHAHPADRSDSSGHVWSRGPSAEHRDLLYTNPHGHHAFVTESHIETQNHSTASSGTDIKPLIPGLSNSTHRSGFVQPEWSTVPSHGTTISRFPFNLSSAPHFCPQTGFSDQYSPVTPSHGNTGMGVSNVDSCDTAFHFPPTEHHLQSSTELGHYLSATHLSDPITVSVAPQFTYGSSALPAKWNKEVAKPHRFSTLRQSSSTTNLNECHFDQSSTCTYQCPQTTSSSLAPDSLVDILDLLNHRPHIGTSQGTTIAPMPISSDQHVNTARRISHSGVGDSITTALFNSTWSRSSTRYDANTFRESNMSDTRIQAAPTARTHPVHMSASISAGSISRDSRHSSCGPSCPSVHESHSFPTNYHSRSFEIFSSVAVNAPCCTNAVYRSSQLDIVDHKCDSEAPERTRHISAPVVQPGVFAHSSSPVSHSTSTHVDPDPHSYSHRVYYTSASDDTSDIATFSADPLDMTSSDAVADLLMQSHITDTVVSESSSTHVRQGDDAVLRPLQIDADYANQTHSYNAHSTGVVTSTISSTSTPGIQPHTSYHSGTDPVSSSTSVGQRNDCGTSTRAVEEEFELADLATGSVDSVDDKLMNSQLTVSQLSKSLAEDNLFRNPHTIPPPKKQKRKPAPIFIPPQTGANLSRLRSPRVWTTDGSSTNPSPPPYTPPPMLSPNRPGSGLFSSLTKWSSTISPIRSASLLNRRNSSCCPPSACSASGDLLRRRSNQSRVHSLTTCNEPEGTSLKRSYANSFVCSSSGQTIAPTYSSRYPIDDHNRVFAFSSRRHQTTPNSAPVVMLCSSGTTVTCRPENASDPSCPPPAISQTNTTVFGYDDETMRRFAEADAADAADRARYRQTHRDERSSSPLHSSDEVPEKLSKLDDIDIQMNYQSNDALVLLEDSLTALHESTTEMDQGIDEDQFMEDEDEGVPSSLVPRINIGEAFQAEIPELSTDRASDLEKIELRETLLWYPGNLDEKDPKNIESLNLLMKIACSPAVRSCGLNMEYTFHLLCKYKGNLEMTLHALLYETLVMYDYVYAETTAWTTEEITRFQHGLHMYGRDFHQISKDLQSMGMNKTVKACVEFYYAWKRMNTPSDVKWYREKARRQRLVNRTEPVAPKEQSGQSVEMEQSQQPLEEQQQQHHQHTAEATAPPEPAYNLRRKPIQPPTTHVPQPMNDHLTATEISPTETLSLFEAQPPNSSSELADVGNTVSYEKSSDNFPCPLCQRVFAKVKSRNAHMKSHTDRPSVTHHRAPTNHGH